MRECLHESRGSCPFGGDCKDCALFIDLEDMT